MHCSREMSRQNDMAPHGHECVQVLVLLPRQEVIRGIEPILQGVQVVVLLIAWQHKRLGELGIPSKAVNFGRRIAHTIAPVGDERQDNLF